jgi:hypothetical protein
MSEWKPASLWDHLEEKKKKGIAWKKIKRYESSQYVAYDGDKEIGFIPIEFSTEDQEWSNWWSQAYKRLEDRVTIGTLMDEITNRYKSRRARYNFF